MAGDFRFSLLQIHTYPLLPFVNDRLSQTRLLSVSSLTPACTPRQVATPGATVSSMCPGCFWHPGGCLSDSQNFDSHLLQLVMISGEPGSSLGLTGGLSLGVTWDQRVVCPHPHRSPAVPFLSASNQSLWKMPAFPSWLFCYACMLFSYCLVDSILFSFCCF